ncbi:PREDICTED: fasciclin-like arabinogalactan protein 4 [Camelina sativa]|uniref:Fasciclin-like arabinogalactan protein 4 n=1 Tax=Camelina sativa TaxID=90675 RepID=A0ABM1RTC5_CAMSA|nr:PREDICTED: fasciclin-like arabinogalactan protein 4 [Camelina sativa]
MANVISISHFTLPALAYLLLLLSSTAAAINVTAVLSSFPNLSSFSNLLVSSGIAAELSGRNSLTLLAVPNSQFSSASVDLTRRLPPSTLADLLRFHVLLQFLSDSDLRRIPPSGSAVTTLYEASGRTFFGSGSVNVTRDPASGSVTIGSPSTKNVTVLKLLETKPPNITVLSVDSLIVPTGIDITASETLTPPPTSTSLSPPPAGINLTQILINGHNFNVALSLLVASGVITEFENDERGAGITVFVPTDSAFSDLPSNVNLQSLPAEQKAFVLKFHVLHSYYTLGSLESITNPVQPTLATEEMGAGSYTLNISRVNGSIVTINSGVVLAVVTQTAFDQNPVSVFGVSKVLLPKELFPKSGQPVARAPPQEISLSPESSDEQPSRLVSPPREIVSSGAVKRPLGSLALWWWWCCCWCIAFCYLLV